MFAFLALLAYRKHWTISGRMHVTTIEDFGFEAGATMTVGFSETTAPGLRYVILNETEYRRMMSLSTLYDSACNNEMTPEDSMKIMDLPQYQIPTRLIPTQRVLYFKVVNCDTASKEDSELDIIHTFTNPSTKMDYRWIGIIGGKKVTCVLFVAIVSVWLANWVMHFSAQIWIHYCFTLTFVILTGMHVIRLLEVIDLDVNDDSPLLESMRISAEVCAAAVFSVTILLAAKGWCIVRDSIGLKELIFSVSFSVIFMVLVTVGRYVYLGDLEIAVWLLALVFFALFVRELILGINNASLHITAHILAITNAGIVGNVEDTPVYRKHVMYQVLQGAIIGGCCVVMVKMCACVMLTVPFWASEILDDLIELFIVATLMFIFRLRDTAISGYADVDGTGDMALSDIEATPSSVVGSEVPEQVEQSVVILASPDGTDAINAHVTGGDTP